MIVNNNWWLHSGKFQFCTWQTWLLVTITLCSWVAASLLLCTVQTHTTNYTTGWTSLSCLVLLFPHSHVLLLTLQLPPAGHPGSTRWARLRGEDGTSRTSRPPPSCPPLLSSPLSLHPPRFGHETCCCCQHTGWGRGPRPRVYHENQLRSELRPQQHQVMSPRPLGGARAANGMSTWPGQDRRGRHRSFALKVENFVLLFNQVA